MDDMAHRLAELRDRLSEEREGRLVAEERLREAEAFITAVVASLDRVVTYEGLGIGRGSALLYLNDLVRDHEELERRIEVAIMECHSGATSGKVERIEKILRGGSPVPDTPDGLLG
jgi:hypothetical protein